MSRKSKRFFFVVLLLAAAVTVAAVLNAGRPERTTVHTAIAERVLELKSIVSASGEIQPKESVDIQAEIAGVIVELPVKEGDRVKKGQILLKIDPIATAAQTAAVRAAFHAAEAEARGQSVQIAMAEANLARDEFLLKTSELERAQSEANYRRAVDNLNRKKALFERQLLSSEELDIATTTVDVAKAALDAADARVAQFDASLKANRIAIGQWKALEEAGQKRVEAARANLDSAEDLFKKTTIYAPIDGLISKLNVEAGERAVPGILSNPQATLMTIADMSIVEARINVDETDVVNVRLGDEALVEVDAIPDRKLAAVVSEIANSPILATGGAASQTTDVKDFEVVLRLAEPDPALRPGLSCSADITTEVRENALVVPVQSLTARDYETDDAGNALVPTPADVDREKAAEKEGTLQAATGRKKKKETTGVFVRGAGDRAEFRAVKTGILGESDIEVLEGLEEGTEVIAGPYQAIRTLEVGDHLKIDNTRKFRSGAGTRVATKR